MDLTGLPLPTENPSDGDPNHIRDHGWIRTWLKTLQDAGVVSSQELASQLSSYLTSESRGATPGVAAIDADGDVVNGSGQKIVPGQDGQDGTNGREVQFQQSATHIQWRLVGDATWNDLVALADLTGNTGPTGPGWISGTGAPTSDVGFDGQMYLNNEEGSGLGDVYGPKANGAWPATPSMNIRGPEGPAGAVTGGMHETLWLPWDEPFEYPDDAPFFAPHYFTPFPIRLEASSPANRWYSTYIAPATGTAYADEGGYIRDMPLTMANPDMNGMWETEGTWERSDMEEEVRQMIAAGCDGITLEQLTLSNASAGSLYHWRRQNTMLQAIDNVNAQVATLYATYGRPAPKPFWAMIMPDGVSGATGSVRTVPGGTVIDTDASADVLADHIAEMDNNYDCLLRIDGNLVWGPFGADMWPAGTTQTNSSRPYFWKRVADRLATTYSKPNKPWLCFVNSWTAAAASFWAHSTTAWYGFGRWGGRDWQQTAGDNTENRRAAQLCWDTYGLPWMHFAAVGDSRPRDDYLINGGWRYRFWEQGGSRQWEESWKACIGAAGWRRSAMAQGVTWNDLTENAHISPTRNHGILLPVGLAGARLSRATSAWIDIASYFLIWYKTGLPPTIKRDGVYLIHRVHRATQEVDKDLIVTGLSASSTQTKFAYNDGTTPYSNDCEALAFLKEPGTIQILSNGTVIASVEAPAGMNRLNVALPTTNGAILSARVQRAGVTVPRTTATSTFPLQSAPLNDDYHPRVVSSLWSL